MKNKLQSIKTFLFILLISCGDVTKTNKESTRVDEGKAKQIMEQEAESAIVEDFEKAKADHQEEEVAKRDTADAVKAEAIEITVKEKAVLKIQKKWKQYIAINKRKKQIKLDINNSIEIENLEWDDMIFSSKQLNEENDAAKKIQQKWIQYKQANKIKRQQQLFESIKKGRDIFTLQIDDIINTKYKGLTPLVLAINNKNVEAVKYLLNHSKIKVLKTNIWELYSLYAEVGIICNMFYNDQSADEDRSAIAILLLNHIYDNKLYENSEEDVVNIFVHRIKSEMNTTVANKCPQLVAAILKSNFIEMFKKDENLKKIVTRFAFEQCQMSDSFKLLVDAQIVDIKYVSESGNTFLIRAVAKGDEELIAYLLMGAADVDIKNNNGKSALVIAFNKWQSITKYNRQLKEDKKNPDKIFICDISIIDLLPGEDESKQILELLISKSKNNHAVQFIKEQIKKNQEEINKIFKEEMEKVIQQKQQLLFDAIDKGEDITNLISDDIINEIYVKTKSTPFIYALLKGNVQAVNLFLTKCNIDFNKKGILPSFEHDTILELMFYNFGARINRLELFKLLLDNIIEDQLYNNIDIVEQLREYVVYIYKNANNDFDLLNYIFTKSILVEKIVDESTKTILMEQVFEYYEISKLILLLNNKLINIDHVIDEEGNTLLIKAVDNEKQQIELIEFLVNAKADIDIKNNDGKTALMIAFYKWKLIIKYNQRLEKAKKNPKGQFAANISSAKFLPGEDKNKKILELLISKSKNNDEITFIKKEITEINGIG